MQEGGLQVADGTLPLGDAVTQLIRCAIDDARFDSAPGHPNGETVRVMVAPEENRAAPRLVHRRAAEFTAPDHERFLEQPPLLEVLDQRRAGAVHIAAFLR